MSKEKFIIELRKRLSLLEVEERDNIIEEYLSYVNQKIYEGISEEEAIEQLGDVNKIAEKILKSHKISDKYIKLFIGKEKVIDEINDFVNKLTDVSSAVFSKIESSISDFARTTGHFAKNIYKESKKFGEEKFNDVKNFVKKHVNEDEAQDDDIDDDDEIYEEI
jgi:hypothetical protein